MNPAFVAVERGWRVFATGLSFTVFGVGTLLLTVTVFPALCLLLPDTERRRRRLRRVFSGGCRFFVRFMKTVGLLDWEVHGREHLAGRARLVLANHPSLIDAVFLLAWMPEAVCIVKQTLRHNPFLGWAVAAAGYIGNADPEGLIEDCVASLRGGDSLIVFPEGTRSVPGRPPVFKRGAARIVLGAQVSVVPVCIRCQPVTLTKGTPWYRVPERPAHYRFEIGSPLPVSQFAAAPGESPAQAARRLTAQLEKLLAPPATGSDLQETATCAAS